MPFISKIKLLYIPISMSLLLNSGLAISDDTQEKVNKINKKVYVKNPLKRMEKHILGVGYQKPFAGDVYEGSIKATHLELEIETTNAESKAIDVANQEGGYNIENSEAKKVMSAFPFKIKFAKPVNRKVGLSTYEIKAFLGDGNWKTYYGGIKVRKLKGYYQINAYRPIESSEMSDIHKNVSEIDLFFTFIMPCDVPSSDKKFIINNLDKPLRIKNKDRKWITVHCPFKMGIYKKVHPYDIFINGQSGNSRQEAESSFSRSYD